MKNWKMAAVMSLALALTAGAAFAQDPCTAPDNGTGTVTLPPAGCEYLTADQVHKIIEGLPPGTEIILAPIHKEFICRQASGTGGCGSPGGSLGGQVEIFASTAVFQLMGTGSLAGWSRTISIPLNTETHTGPRPNGATVQSFPTDMYRIQGALYNDPDFDVIEITGGTANGFPSPGHTILTRQPSGHFVVDSVFNVQYSIRYIGSANGKLKGAAGTTKARSASMKAVKACP